jgi:catechol 2,3-dioxygenase-like lactoylglutathione lyase family enzyme
LIRGLNHLTLGVRALDRAVRFYMDGLGAHLARRWPGGAYLTLGDLWLCLSPDPAAARGRNHTYAAVDVAEEDFAAALRRLRGVGAQEWKQDRSEGASHSFLDSAGHRPELHVGTLAKRLAPMEGCL